MKKQIIFWIILILSKAASAESASTISEADILGEIQIFISFIGIIAACVLMYQLGVLRKRWKTDCGIFIIFILIFNIFFIGRFFSQVFFPAEELATVVFHPVTIIISYSLSALSYAIPQWDFIKLPK